MKIATFNVNGVNGWLPVLLKAPQEKFPAPALREAGYGAIWHRQKSWNGVAILARGSEPIETRRGLPGDPDDAHRRIYRGGRQWPARRLDLSAQR